MADTSTRPSPDDATPGRLQLPSTHTGLLFRGLVASVYYHRQPPFASPELSYSQAKVVIAFDLASGVLRRWVGGAWRTEQLAGRGVFCLPSNVVHEVRWEHAEELIEVYYEPVFFRELMPALVAAVFERDSLSEAATDPVIWDLALAICLWCKDGRPAESAITDIGVLIGKRLFDGHADSPAARNGPKFTPEQRHRLDEYIQANIAKRFRLAQLAKVASLSVSHFVTLCRNTTGKPPMDYVRECRLRKAHAMARTGQHRRREIARACGFYDGSHLNREFKKFFKHPLAPLSR